jgi:hypothetical protein
MSDNPTARISVPVTTGGKNLKSFPTSGATTIPNKTSTNRGTKDAKQTSVGIAADSDHRSNCRERHAHHYGKTDTE